MSTTTLESQERLASILYSAFILMRMANPTVSRSSYGKAETVFGTGDPTDWNPYEVQALFNLNGIIADGLHNLPLAIASEDRGAEDELGWFVRSLDEQPIPHSIYEMHAWERFCHLLADRTLGQPISTERSI